MRILKRNSVRQGEELIKKKSGKVIRGGRKARKGRKKTQKRTEKQN